MKSIIGVLCILQLTVLLTVFAGPTVAPTAPSLPLPNWNSPCPNPSYFSKYFESCSNVTVYQNWYMPSADTVTFWLGRAGVNNPPVAPTTTIWYLGETCYEDNANHPGDWGFAMQNDNTVVVEVHFRGSPLAWPTLDCGADVDVNGIPTAACATKLAASNIPAYTFSADQMANDLHFILSGPLATPINIIIADGFSTVIAQRMQALYPAVASTVYILAGVTAPDTFDYFNTLSNYDTVAQLILSECQQIPQCAAQAGGGQNLDKVLDNVLAAAREGSLACNSKLKWDVSSYAIAYSNIFAMLVSSSSNVFRSTNSDTLAFLPAVLYRLQRCSATDVIVLTTLYRALNTTSATAPVETGGCVPSAAQRATFLFNELVQNAPPPLQSILQQNSLNSIQPPTSFLQAMYPLYAAWPKYTSRTHTYGNSQIATYLLAGDMDAVTSFPMAEFTTLKYNLPNYKFYRLPGIPNKAMANPTAAACVIAAVAQIRNATLPPYAGCAGIALDFMAQQPSSSRMFYFGVNDIWQFDNVQPPIVPGFTPAPTQQPGVPTPVPLAVTQNDDLNKAKETAAAFIALFSLTLLGILIYAYWRHKKSNGGGYNGQGDFYSNLNKAT